MKVQLIHGTCIIEDSDYYLFHKYAFFSKICKNKPYVIRSSTIEPDLPIYLHRLILFNLKININGYEIDHKDNNTLNNTHTNLRVATHSQNGMNKGLSSINLTGYKGISYDVRRGKWKSRIMFNREEIWLGYFKTDVEAAIAYNQMARRLFKEFAWLNEV